MKVEVISEGSELVVRRQILDPGESTPWHVDPCRRFTVVVHGSSLRIDYRDGPVSVEVPLAAGAAAWDEPEPRVHRAVNTGASRYEEVVLFHRPGAGTDPQPVAP